MVSKEPILLSVANYALTGLVFYLTLLGEFCLLSIISPDPIQPVPAISLANVISPVASPVSTLCIYLRPVCSSRI